MSVAEGAVPPRPTGGVDWAWENHAVAVVGPDGVARERFTVEHSVSGLRTLVRRLLAAGVEEVAMERSAHDGKRNDGSMGRIPRLSAAAVASLSAGRDRHRRMAVVRGLRQP